MYLKSILLSRHHHVARARKARQRNLWRKGDRVQWAFQIFKIWYDQQTNIFQFTLSLIVWNHFCGFYLVSGFSARSRSPFNPTLHEKTLFSTMGMARKLDQEIAIICFHHVLDYQLLKTWNKRRGLQHLPVTLVWGQQLMTEVIDSLDFANANLFQKHGGFFLHVLPRWLKRVRWLLDFAATFFQRERKCKTKRRL